LFVQFRSPQPAARSPQPAARSTLPGATVRRPALLALLAALTACDPASVNAPADVGGARTEPALVRFAEQDAAVALPDTVAAGATFTLVVTTFGGGCVREVRAPTVRMADTLVAVSLFHHHTGADVCTDDLKLLEHRVALRAGGRGRMVVQLQGANRGRETAWTTVPWVLTRTLVVR
jgi:hypothetical protein